MNYFKKSFASALLALLVTLTATAQVGVGTNSPNASAQLDVSSTTKGLLPPRMTYAQQQAISSPAIGLMIYCTNCGPGTGEPQFYNGTAWVNMIGGTGLTRPPAVGSTTATSNITGTRATSGGNITNDFGNTISARGVCWSTTSSPTTSDSKTTESGTTGSFTSNISGLSLNTLYYVRAYATNASGTSYGAEVSFTTAALPHIGDSYQGGIVAYILQPGDPGHNANVQRGLIAAASDQGTAEWGCINTPIAGAQGEAIGTGNQNTIGIINACSTAGIAARICGDLVLNGYSDWYLPSKDELNKLYINRVAIGGFQNVSYWSSSEPNSSANAWYQYFQDGNAYYGPKNNLLKVRAIRAF